MAQLNFWHNAIGALSNQNRAMSNGTLSFCPMILEDSISIGTLNLYIQQAANGTRTFSIGLYSLTGSTLSIINSWSQTYNSRAYYFTCSNTSANQNITPGTWWLGLLVSTSGTSNAFIYGQTSINPANAFPGGFIGGRMSDSTNALPSSYATSDLDITGNDAMFVPFILLTA